jgi:hypothetical protein
VIPAGGGEVDPTTITGCTEWVSGDQASLSSLANNDPVTTWLDRVTGTRNWSASGTVRPLFKTGGPNGKSYLAWDTDDEFNFSNGVSTILSGTGYTMFIVCRPQRNGVNDDPQWCPVLLGPQNGYVGVSLRNVGAGNKFVLYQYNSGYASVSSTTTYVTNTWYIVECWYDGTNINIKVNNDTAVSTAKASPASLANTPPIGGNLQTDIAERQTWNVDIGSSNRTTMRNSLASKYGITLA